MKIIKLFLAFYIVLENKAIPRRCYFSRKLKGTFLKPAAKSTKTKKSGKKGKDTLENDMSDEDEEHINQEETVPKEKMDLDVSDENDSPHFLIRCRDMLS
uniref:Uncharacterized protein n=1 Tax=Cacopsylla melanoneura TaxID=428564 RepID=A0A8D8U224_9HEMI